MALPPEVMIALGLASTFVIIAVVLCVIVSIKSFKAYNTSKSIGTFYFALSVIAAGISLAFVLAEKTVLIFTTDDLLGIALGDIAIVGSSVAIVSICAFAFNMAFTQRWKILALIVALLLAVHVFFWYYGPIYVSLFRELVPSDITKLTTLGISTPLLIIPMIVFFYYAFKIRTEAAEKSRMALFMGLGLLCFNLGTIVEILGIDDLVISTIGRFLFIPAILFYYWGLFKVKKKE